MKFFSRMMMVVALLGVLAYGSFAFGKYVLSAKLFGDDANSSSLRNVSRSTTEASAVTRQTGWKGTKPRVDVKVLPADDSSVADVPAFADEDGFNKEHNDDADSSTRTRRAPRVETPEPAPKLGTRKFDDASVEYTLGSEKDNEDRSRRRRRRRSRSRTSEKRDSETPKAPEPNTGDSAEVTARSTSPSETSRSASSDSGSSDSSPSRSSSSRERSSSDNERPRESTRTRERTRRQSSDSPVPRPEGSGSSGGGDSANISPVPQPE